MIKCGNMIEHDERLALFLSRGYRLRKHVKEVSWDKRKLTVVDLTETEMRILHRGGIQSLSNHLARKKQWLFPEPVIENILPLQRETYLSNAGKPSAVVLAPQSKPALRQAARNFVSEIKKRFRLILPLCDADTTNLKIADIHNVILFGGGHENRFTRDLALRYLCGIADAEVPGEGGWLVTTYVGLAAVNTNILLIAASSRQLPASVRYVLGHVKASGGAVRVNHLHRVVPGSEMRNHLISWKGFLDLSIGEARRPALRRAKPPLDPAQAADLFGKGLDSGGPEKNYYNVFPICAAISAARYFFLTADPRAIVFFRTILFKLADYYLKTPRGASYISDMDFYLGLLIHYYGLLEHYPVFSPDDRLVLSNLLLACTQTVYDYYEEIWKPRYNRKYRHNHETFKGRTLFLAAHYFARHGMPAVKLWSKKADQLFRGDHWNRYKQIENANIYEPLVFEHLASYSAFQGNRFNRFGSQVLRRAAWRQMICTDNFFRPVDYGDSAVCMDSRNSDSLAVMAAFMGRDPHLQWFCRNSFRQSYPYLTPVLFALTGLRQGEAGTCPPRKAWELAPLDPHARRQYAPGFPGTYAFDKVAYRTGWGPDDHYVLFNGFGNLAISHSHNELNGILRLNHLGRHWLISNGYGKKPGIVNASKSYYSRVLGPEDHNMLVLTNQDEIERNLPPACALMYRGSRGNFAWLTSALFGYSGTNWYRTLVVLANAWLLVIDRVQKVERKEIHGHFEWNALGQLQRTHYGWRLTQKGVFMDVFNPSCWETRSGRMDSDDWKKALKKNDYPHADYPPRKMLFDLPNASGSGILTFATLFAATRSTEPTCSVRQIAPGHYGVQGPGNGFSTRVIGNRDLRIGFTKKELEIQVSLSPRIPAEFGNVLLKPRS